MRRFLVFLTVFLCPFQSRTAQAAPDLEVTLRGAFRTSTVGTRSTLGLVEIGVPFDVVGAPRAASIRSSALAEPDDAGLDPEQDEEDAKREREEARARARARATAVAESLSRPLARATVKVALRRAGLDRAAQRLDSLGSRARLSAALPELKLRGGRSTDESLRLSPTLDDPYRYTESGGTDLFFDAALTWKLGRLVFASEEIAVERLRQQEDTARLKLTEAVLDVLARWHRARVREELLLGDDAVMAMLDRIEAELALDALTGGWFGDAIRVEERKAEPRAKPVRADAESR